MRRIILSLLGVLLIVGAFFGAKAIIANKKKPKPKIDKVIKRVTVLEAINGPVAIVIPANGYITAKNQIELFSEVQGGFKNTGRLFKAGQHYSKGELLVRIDASEYYASVQAAKSNFYNLLASILPDLQLDYPEAFLKWKNYLDTFNMNTAVQELPQITSGQEKLFIAGRNILSSYYNIKNLEARLAKYSIKAPFSGVLTEALVTQGTLVRSGQKLGTFINLDIFEMQVSIPAAYSHLLKEGTMVSLKNLENTRVYQGKVVRINASVNQNSQTVSAFIEVKGEGLKEGMYLQANLTAKQEENAIEVARNLLHEKNEIFIVDNDSILNVLSVTPVFFSEKKVVIKGIPDGTKLLAKPVSGAYKGMLVSVNSKADKTVE